MSTKMSMPNGLNLEVRVPFAQCVDFKTAPKRNDQSKWTQRGDVCILNPKYPLSMDERDQINFSFLLQIFRGDLQAMRDYYNSKNKDAGFSDEENKFIEDSRSLYERYSAQSDDKADIKFPHAKDWLIAHGIKPAILPHEMTLQARALQACDFTEEKVLNLFDEDNVRAVLAATGETVLDGDKATNLNMYCKRVLRDDPNRPIELADFSSAVFVMESWKSLQRALFRGVGAKPKIAVTRAELQADLRALNLPWELSTDTQSSLWQRLYLHVFKRASRKHIENWFTTFGFNFVTPRTQRPLNLKSLPKRVLFDMIGQLSTGTVSEECDNTVHESAAYMYTSDTIIRDFLRQSQLYDQLTSDEKTSKEAMFRLYCAEKLLHQGFMFKDASVLPVDPKEPETKEDLIDELLEQGVWATMVLSECQKQRIETLLGMDTASPQFATNLRALLKPYLSDEFLWSWLKLYHPTNLNSDASLLEEYMQVSICQRGAHVEPKQPIVYSGDGEINAKLKNWSDTHVYPVTAKAEEFREIGVCKSKRALLLDVESDAIDGDRTGDPTDMNSLEFRNRRVRLFFELINSLYMVAPAQGKLYEIYITKVADEMIKAKLRQARPEKQDEKKLMISDFNLWLEGMASPKVLMLLLAARTVDKSSYNIRNLESMLRAIAQNNLDNFMLINGWAERQDAGELCWKGDMNILNDKLRLLSVPLMDASTGRQLSDKRKIYAYMHLLDHHLDVGVKERLLNQEDYRKVLEDTSVITPFARCFSKYCEKFNASKQEVALIVQFDANQAGSVLLSWSAATEIAHNVPQDRTQLVMQNQGAGCSKTIVSEEDLEDASIVELVTVTKRRILHQKKGEMSVDHYLVSMNGENIEYLDPIFEPLWEVVAYFQSNGEFVHRIGDKTFTQ